jgi:hypothetical protein
MGIFGLKTNHLATLPLTSASCHSARANVGENNKSVTLKGKKNPDGRKTIRGKKRKIFNPANPHGLKYRGLYIEVLLSKT